MGVNGGGDSKVVTIEAHGEVRVALVDRPPVNAIDAAMRRGLFDAVRDFAADSSARVLLIACRGRTFMSGADLSELGSVVPPPSYRDLLGSIENCDKPIVASLHGTALGGGLELAMACHFRCAIPSARMGMPEITLGILPGAGGTQRLPRLVGAEQALELLLSGAPIDAARGKQIGLIDEIVDGDAVSGGIAFAKRLAQSGAKPRRTREQAVDAAGLADASVQALLSKHARALKGRTTQELVLESVRAAAAQPFDAGLDLEARLSADSLTTAESRALRHVFFAERECGRVPGVTGASQTPAVECAAVVGAGTMGSGIAMALADAGIRTWLIENNQAALDRGLAMIRDNYAGTVKRGRLDAAGAEQRIQRITGTLDMGAARDATLAIEAVFEDFELKKRILGGLDKVLPPGAILASNTSSLSVTALAKATGREDRVIGLHFFSPANIMRLLEIVRGERTSQDTILAGLALAKTLRKVGVVVGDGFGFVGNRMMLDGYFREAELLLLQGVAPERIDAVMEKFGFAMGPNRVNDMAGVDVGTKVRIELAKREHRPAPYHAVSDTFTPLGRLGQKTGKGIYRYEPGDRTPKHDPESAVLIAEIAAKLGVSRRDVSDAEVEQRCVLSLVNVGAQVLAEGMAYRASDIDVIWTSGYGFPRWRGGPMCYADELGLPKVVETIRRLGATEGSDYWRVAPLLKELADSGRSFADWDRERKSGSA
jgi:3-hydroxyacyl-CoA dehydrogenase